MVADHAIGFVGIVLQQGDGLSGRAFLMPSIGLRTSNSRFT